MKTEAAIREQVQAYTYQLRTTDDIKDVIRTQGLLDALEWVLSDEEEKPEETD